MPLTRFLSATYIRDYFRSGWAFLIPYLAAYLFHAWLKWPVNPVNGGQWTVIPCLLHAYWFLHAVHLVLGMIALRTWWRRARQEHAPHRPSTELTRNAEQATGNRLLATIYRLLPWLCLGLLFYIPGVYLEWPSDPWHHLQRINWWHDMDFVTADSSWLKSSYFIPYSLLSWATGLRQLFWLDFYYTGICLLLCWQYYRLARACDLGERASMIFVLIQALLIGNNIFSFYRYYGISSSIYAQLGAVALIRIILEALRPREEQTEISAFQSLSSEDQRLKNEVQPTDYWRPHGTISYFLFPASCILQLVCTVIFLLTLIAFNHVQGIGIAGLGVSAVFVWRLIQWKRSMIMWLIGVATLLSVATVIWFPRHADIDAVYRPQGWLNAWYGFNFFDPSSIVLQRSLHILGAFGLLNLATALWLIRRNHIAGWLTLMPIIALALPCVALPFAQLIASTRHTTYIITFHRMLFAIPIGLALVTTLSQIVNSAPAQHPSIVPVSLSRSCAFLIIPMALGAALIIPPSKTSNISVLSYNRSWNALAIVPTDLRRESAEGQTSFISQAAYLSQHWSPIRNTSITPKLP